jgi:hypothetical protein
MWDRLHTETGKLIFNAPEGKIKRQKAGRKSQGKQRNEEKN